MEEPASSPAGHRDLVPSALIPGPMVQAALCACGAAVLAREAGLAAAVACCVAAIFWTLLRRRAGPWLLAVPAALGAAPAPETPIPWPPPGPVRIDAVVQPGVRQDRLQRRTSLRLRNEGGTFYCTVTGLPEVLPGDRVRGIARLRKQERRRRRGLAPRVEMAADALSVSRGPPSLSRLTEACRLRLERSLLDLCRGEAGILLCHLVLGRGPDLPQDLRAAHQASGLAHLLAVSGAHASMLGWMLGLLFRVLRGRPALGSRAYRLFCASFLLLYAAITGMQPPVFRAVVAFVLVLVAAGRGRRVRISTALALPALLSSILQPSELLGVSFCLSYAAVFGLALAGSFTAAAWHQRWLRLPLQASCWATLTTMPLTLAYFGQIAPWTILATPLLGPLVAVMLVSGLGLAVLSIPLPGLAAVGAVPLACLTRGYCAAVRAVASLPLAPVRAPALADASLLVAGAIVGLLALARWPDRRGIAALCLALSLPHFVVPAAPPAALHLLAVGHGQACLAWLPDGRSVLVDCGSLGNPARAAKAVKAALLPVRSLDLLVLTHGDFDHVDGVERLLARVTIKHAVLPTALARASLGALLRAHGTEVRSLPPGARQRIGKGVSLVRPATAALSRNDRSIWVRLDLATFSALVPGDPQEAGVAAWLADRSAATAEVLVLPHHGRENRAATALLAAVRPRLVLVSNREGEDTTAQAEIARAAGLRVLHTGTVGTITVLGGDPPMVSTEEALPLLR